MVLPDNLRIVQVLTWRGGRVVSALEAEREGMRLALEWVDQLTVTSGPVLIASDSRSLLAEIRTPSAADDSQLVELRRQLEGSKQHIVIQWVPGHCGLIGNERADMEARTASTGRRKAKEEGRSVPLCTAKARIRRLIVDPPVSHVRTKLVYQGIKGKAVLSRKEAVLLAQLRSGHCRRLAAYRHVVEEGVSPTCPNCKKEPEDMVHWLQKCPATAEKRRKAFGGTSPPLSVLYQEPVAALAYACDSWVV